MTSTASWSVVSRLALSPVSLKILWSAPQDASSQKMLVAWLTSQSLSLKKSAICATVNFRDCCHYHVEVGLFKIRFWSLYERQFLTVMCVSGFTTEYLVEMLRFNSPVGTQATASQLKGFAKLVWNFTLWLTVFFDVVRFVNTNHDKSIQTVSWTIFEMLMQSKSK